MQVNGKMGPARSKDVADTATLRRSLRVLIVDDHPIIVSACRAMFAGDPDVTIIEASDAESGEAAFTVEGPDVCVLDINLPGVIGFELARRILAKSPHERIIMFSMNDDPVFAKRAIEAGAKGYVSKSGRPCARHPRSERRRGLPAFFARTRDRVRRTESRKRSPDEIEYARNRNPAVAGRWKKPVGDRLVNQGILQDDRQHIFDHQTEAGLEDGGRDGPLRYRGKTRLTTTAPVPFVWPDNSRVIAEFV
jgi:DNA-binding NarL/FixJ family response regulator